MSHDFVAATTSIRIDETDDRITFRSEIHQGWEIGNISNGGYLLALVARAMADVAARPPLTVTGHYLSPARPGEATIVVEPVRAGRQLATLRATLSSGGRDVLAVLGTFGRLATDGPSLMFGGPPELPPFDESLPMPPPTEPPLPTLNDRLAARLRPGDDGFRRNEPTGRGEIAGWLALAEEQPFDEIGLLLAADSFPPPVFNTDVPVGWVPTVELTVHVRAVPAPGPLRVAFRSRFIDRGMLEEDGELWDATGRLVAQSRQLALVPRV